MINDLLTVYGLFNQFDYRCLKNIYVDKENGDDLSVSLYRLKKYNEIMYEHINLAQNLSVPTHMITFIMYNYSLINMDMQFNRAINDLFTNMGKVTNLSRTFQFLNEVMRLLMHAYIWENFFSSSLSFKEKKELISKLVFTINQSLCAKYKDKKLIWMFEKINPVKPFKTDLSGSQNDFFYNKFKCFVFLGK